jgi:hypothetical protein
VDLPAFRAHKSVEAGPPVTLVDLHDGPLSDGAPHLADDRLEAQAVLASSHHSSILAVG